MRANIYWIHKFENSANIGIMPRPRGGDWLEDEIRHLERNNVNLIVSLLERDEIFELELGKEEQICKEHGLMYVNFPIVDRSIPLQLGAVDKLVDQLVEKISAGNSVVIHCRMGIGRSTIIAASVLLRYKFKVKDIIANITAIRGMRVPDTDEQLGWLKSRESKS